MSILTKKKIIFSVLLVFLVGAIILLWLLLRTHLLLVSGCLLLLVLLCVSYLLWRRYDGRKLLAKLSARFAKRFGLDSEGKSFKCKLRQAIKQLKKIDSGAKYYWRRAVYNIPWVMLIGNAGCGKSTLVTNSGLHFSLYGDEKIQQLGDSKVDAPDLWLSDKALFIEQSGHCSSVVLLQLRKQRPHPPLDAIIVTISLPELLLMVEDDLAEYVKSITQQISDVYRMLRYSIPITFVVTKFDQATGFIDFFSDLTKDEQRQLFGLELDSDYESKLGQLEARIYNLRWQKISEASTVAEKFAIFNFAWQFGGVCTKLNNFLSLLFKDNSDQNLLVYQGVYFASVSPNDEKPYFIHALIQKIVDKKHGGIDGRVKRLSGQRKSYKFAALCLVIILGGLLLFNNAYNKNQALLYSAAESINNLKQSLSLAKLANSFALYQKLRHYKDYLSFYQRLGFYRGTKAVKPLRRQLAKSMEYAFLRPMVLYLTQQLQHFSYAWLRADAKGRAKMRGSYYLALNAYLMLGAPQQAHKAEAEEIFSYFWQKLVFKQQGKFKYAKQLIDFYLQRAAAWPIDSSLVTKAEQQLYLSNSGINQYAALEQLLKSRLPQVTLKSLLPAKYSQLFISSDGFSALYTKGIWQKIVKPKIMQLFASDFSRNLSAKYQQHYQRAWLHFLNTVHLKPFTSLNDAADKIDLLASSHGAIALLLSRVLINLHQSSVLNSLPAYLKQLQQLHNELLQLSAEANAQQEVQSYAAKILSSSDKTLELYKTGLIVNKMFENRVNSYTPGMRHSRPRSGSRTGYGGNLLASKVLKNFLAPGVNVSAISTQDLEHALRHFLLQPITAVWQLMLATAADSLNQQWQIQVADFYQQKLAHKFPFDLSSNEDAPLDDVAEFFAPEHGLLAQFIHNRLMPFVKYSAGKWQDQQWLGMGLKLSSQAKQALTRALSLSDALFSHSQSPKFTLRLYALPTPELSSITLSSNGQKISYYNGPQQWQTLTWPGHVLAQQGQQEQEQDAELSVTTIAGAEEPEPLQATGVWGLLRLLQQARLRKQRGLANRYHLTWLLKRDNHRYKIRFLLHDRSGIVQRLLYQRLQLPHELFANRGSLHETIVLR